MSHNEKNHNGSCRIALLTPYSGRNLGDWAIQATFIEKFRERCPHVELVGLTQKPGRTAEIHGIPCYPITGLEIQSYSTGLFERVLPSASGEDGSAGKGEGADRPPNRVYALIKRIPGVVAVWRSMRAAVEFLRNVGRELLQLWRSWSIVRGVDLVLVAGGGQLDDEWGGCWGHPYSLFRWAMLARLCGRRFAVASVGWCTLRSPLSRWFVRTALASSCWRSYRDPGSLNALSGWHFTRDDECVADVALALPVRTERSPARREGSGRSVVGLSPIVFGHTEAWPTADHQTYLRYIGELAQATAALLEMGHEVTVFTSSHADRRAVEDLREQLSRITERTESLRIEDTGQLDRLIAVLDRCELVIASRLHGVILAHRLAKPVVAISFDRKVYAHMEMMRQSRYCLDIRTVTASELLEAFQALSEHAALTRQQLAGLVARLQGPIERQFERLLGLAGCPHCIPDRTLLESPS